MKLSIVTPAYNEEENLPLFRAELAAVLASCGIDWEWIVVDDHSYDGTWAVLQKIAAEDPHLRAVRLARNSGSHIALACGLRQAQGDCAVVLAADLQDPPQTIPLLLEKWKSGAQMVWAVREHREGESAGTRGFARLYYWIMRRFVGIRDMPSSGADFVLLDRRVILALRGFKETNVSLLALLTWIGFKQDRIFYTKKARYHGQSGWNMEKKLKLVVDSVTTFSFRPVRIMTYVGFIVASLGFLFAVITAVRALGGIPVQGWASLMVTVLVLGGVQMLMIGVLGEYLWRALDEARNRPQFVVEDEIGVSAGGPSGKAGS